MQKKVKSGIFIQANTIALLVFQSLVIPYIIGVERYGIVVMVSTPFFFVGAFFEPFIQNVVIKNGEESSINFTLIFLFFSVFIGELLLLMAGVDSLCLIFVYGVLSIVYFLSIWLQSCYYYRNELKAISTAFFVGFIGACFVSLVLLFILNIENEYLYFSFFFFYQSILFIFLFFENKRNFYLLKSCFQFPAIDITQFFDAWIWRLPFIVYTVGYFYFLSLIATPKIVGEVRIAFTFFLGLRYLVPYNTPMLHKLMNETTEKKRVLLNIFLFCSLLTIVFFLFLYLLLALGFRMQFLEILMEYKGYFFIVPIIISMQVLGSYYIFISKTKILLQILLISISFFYIFFFNGIDIHRSYSLSACLFFILNVWKIWSLKC